MKVMQVVDELSIGGTSKIQVIYGQAASAHGVDLVEVSFGDGSDEILAEEFTSRQIPVAYFPADKLFDLKRITRFTRYIRETRPQVIQAHLTYQNIVSCICGRLAGVPVYCTLHSQRIKDEFYHPVKFQLELLCLKYLATGVIAVGESIRKAYEPYMGKKKMFVVLNPINPQAVPTSHSVLAEKETLFPGGGPLAVAVGRLVPAKAYPDLIDAFALVVKQVPRACLMVLGEGELHAALQEKVNSLGLQDRIMFPGERPDVSGWLAAADVFVSSSHWEGLPIALLEGMAAGLPVVATRVGDVPLVVQPECGELVPPGEPGQLAAAISAFLQSPEKRQRMGLAARTYVEKHHSVDNWMEQLNTIFKPSVETTR